MKEADRTMARAQDGSSPLSCGVGNAGGKEKGDAYTHANLPLAACADPLQSWSSSPATCSTAAPAVLAKTDWEQGK